MVWPILETGVKICQRKGSLFGRFEETKTHSEINWPLEELLIPNEPHIPRDNDLGFECMKVWIVGYGCYFLQPGKILVCPQFSSTLKRETDSLYVDYNTEINNLFGSNLLPTKVLTDDCLKVFCQQLSYLKIRKKWKSGLRTMYKWVNRHVIAISAQNTPKCTNLIIVLPAGQLMVQYQHGSEFLSDKKCHSCFDLCSFISNKSVTHYIKSGSLPLSKATKEDDLKDINFMHF